MAIRLGALWTLPVVICGGLAAQTPLPVKRPADALDGPPVVHAKAWAIGDGKTGELLHGHLADKPLPMASTTKVMTAFVVLELAKKRPKVFDETVVVTQFAGTTRGSSARIQPGDRVKVGDLLFGLLLPSGNDAANALAQHFGKHFAKPKDPKSIPWSVRSAARDQSWVNFVAEMNRTAKRLKLAKTRFVNPHGLDSTMHHASARDLIRLAHAAMQHERFREVVGTREYKGPIRTAAGRKRTQLWRNTNQLLHIEGFLGVKTGTTSKAGACLISKSRRGKDSLFVVVLNSTRSNGRYVDSRNLYRWAFAHRAAGGK